MQNLNAILEKLKRYKDNDDILSLYLSFDEIRSPSEDKFDSLVRSLFNTLAQDSQDQFKDDIEKIIRYLQREYKRSGTRTIIFFSSGKKLWQVLELEFALPQSINIDKKANLDPLISKLPFYSRYMVLAVDRKKALIFTVQLGKIEKQKNLYSDEVVPQKVKAKRHDSIVGKEDKIFRNIEDSLRRYLKDISKQAFSFFSKAGEIDFILLAGHKEMFAKIHDLLPKIMSDKVREGFVTELNIPLNKIFLHSKEIVKKIQENNLGKNI